MSNKNQDIISLNGLIIDYWSKKTAMIEVGLGQEFGKIYKYSDNLPKFLVYPD